MLFTLFFQLFDPQVSQAKLFYSLTGDSPAKIEARDRCAPKIGSGANLVEKGQSYLGKCEGAGIAPELGQIDSLRNYLRFRTNPKTMAPKDRSELAVTQEFFPFKKQIYVGFKIMIPVNVSATNGFFYGLQFWQCSQKGPIAGLRISRGTSHRINFVTRGDGGDNPSFGSFNLQPGAWHKIIIGLNPNPRDGLGEMKVWLNGSGTPFIYKGSFGYLNLGACNEPNEPKVRPSQAYRVKFGIYKANEPQKNFEVRIDDLRIGDTYTNVKPI